jgi:hypothetical protein
MLVPTGRREFFARYGKRDRGERAIGVALKLVESWKKS